MNSEIIVSARLAFSDALFEPKVVAGGKPRYSVCLILDDESLAKCREIVNAIAKEEFGGKVPEGKECALREGNKNISAKTGEVYSGFENAWYISSNRAVTQGAPLVLDSRKDPDTGKPRVIKDRRDERAPQAGDYVRAKVSFFSINGKNDRKANPTFGRKIANQLEVIQFAREGEKFGNSKPTSAGFDALPDDEAELSALA